METYKIVRFRREEGESWLGEPEVIRTGLTLEEAQAWCKDPNTREEGVWFDGYDFDRD